ncbi:MAG: MBOAT family O-acyltransferase [Candidatus Peribacter sp.]|nr:MBOAT family O-acyltransferase [Candidatus Peribacter sp.]
MALHSVGFLFVFLPLTLLAFVCVKRLHVSGALVVLTAASVLFYALQDVNALPVLLGSLVWNYSWSFFLDQNSTTEHPLTTKLLLAVSITGNILLLAFFKYIPTLSLLLPQETLPPSAETLVLPFAISFFTFTQISYLIEVANGDITQPTILHYCTYVLFFPKLIAGPIARASAMLPQLSPENLRVRIGDGFIQGLSFLVIGLFKKVVIADHLALVVTPIFASALRSVPTFYRAWFGTTAYGLQLYFDFSGYTDMAIGIALFFGIALPMNFNSPYTSVTIAEFWRRWHITLGSFFRNYVYIPLGGNRCGFFRKLINLLIVMFLVGIWHGSGVTFAIWGALHGLCMCIHTAWVALKKKLGGTDATGGSVGRLFGRALTFFTITVLWVFFRAENLSAAMRMLRAMFSMPLRAPSAGEFLPAAAVLIVPLIIVWFLPTTQRWLGYTGNETPEPAIVQPTGAIAPQVTDTASAGRFAGLRSLGRGLMIGGLGVCAAAFLSQGVAFIYGNF